MGKHSEICAICVRAIKSGLWKFSNCFQNFFSDPSWRQGSTSTTNTKDSEANIQSVLGKGLEMFGV